LILNLPTEYFDQPASRADDARLLGLALLDYLMVTQPEGETDHGIVRLLPARICADLAMSYADFQTGLIWLQAHHLIDLPFGSAEPPTSIH
jgi:hypothetical protein